MSNFTLLMQVLIPAAILFLADLGGEAIPLSNRFLKALAQAALFGVVYGLLNGSRWLELSLVATGLVFLTELAGNAIEMNNRVLNALVRTGIFAVIFGMIILYFSL